MLSPSRIVTETLVDYFTYISECLGKPAVLLPGATISFSNSLLDPSFNFVFTNSEITVGDNLEKAYDHVNNDLKMKATWVIEPGLREISKWLEKKRISQISKPKKMFLNTSDYIFPDWYKNHDPELELNLIESEQELLEYDKVCAQCFNHDIMIAFDLFKSFFNQKELRLGVMLLRKKGIVHGGCIMYIRNESVGFYADAVLHKYRHAGLGSFMVLKRIELARSLGCEYAIAQCYPASVGVYERLGFQNIGNLILQSN